MIEKSQVASCKSQVALSAMCQVKSFVSWFLLLGTIACAICFGALMSLCYAQPVSSGELIAHGGQYDGQTVIYQGEAIGDVMSRGSHAWVNVNDGENTMGIWVPLALARQITYTGSYKSRGDRVEVVGIFHRACPEHGGDMDIHAQVLRKISGGRGIEEKLNTSKKNQVVILGALCILIWILTQFARK